MIHTLIRLEKLISEAETRKKFLEQGVKALHETLDEANAELQSLKASADEMDTPSASPNPTTRNESIKD